jgi:hypothetical protein
MTPRKKIGYFTKLDPELREAMRRFKEATGVPEAQQIDRALRDWLDDKSDAWEIEGVAKAARKRAATRRRA